MAASPKANNWWLIQFRTWHTWLGVAVSLVVVSICLTGLYLNHKDLFPFDKPTVKGKKGHRPQPSGDAVALRTSSSLAQLPLSFDAILNCARQEWGDTEIDRIELKIERGQPWFKIKSTNHQELLIHGSTGEILEKNQKNGLGKFLHDLHTGQIVGLTGKLIVDFTSFVLLILTGTGIYLWLVPRLRKKRSARERAASAPTPSALPSEKKPQPEPAGF